MKTRNSIITLAVSLVFAIVGCTSGSQGQTGDVKNIKQEEYTKILKEESAVVIDVRTPAEVSEGYIKEATVFADINGSDFESQIDQLDKSKTYVVYCRSGGRSTSASEYMLSKGFTKVYNLEGGISQWKGEVTKP